MILHLLIGHSPFVRLKQISVTLYFYKHAHYVRKMKNAIIPMSHKVIQPQHILCKLTGVAVLRGRQPAGGADLPENGVLDGRIPGPVRVGGDGGGIEVVREDPLQGILLSNHRPQCNRRSAGEVELLRFLPRRGDFEVVVSAGVVGGCVVDNALDHVAIPVVKVPGALQRLRRRLCLPTFCEGMDRRWFWGWARMCPWAWTYTWASWSRSGWPSRSDWTILLASESPLGRTFRKCLFLHIDIAVIP